MKCEDITQYLLDRLAESTQEITREAYEEVVKDLLDELAIRLKASQECHD